MVSSSRFIARPMVPSSNSSSSFTFASGRPDTRAIPSPTSTTRPTCSAVTAGLKSVTCLRSASVISLALMVSSVITYSFCLLFRCRADWRSRPDAATASCSAPSRPLVEASRRRSPISTRTPPSRRGSSAIWSSTSLPVMACNESTSSCWMSEERSRAVCTASDAPVRATGRRSSRGSRGFPTTSRGRPPDDGESCQGQARSDLPCPRAADWSVPDATSRGASRSRNSWRRLSFPSTVRAQRKRSSSIDGEVLGIDSSEQGVGETPARAVARRTGPRLG